ncbi:AAA domain-containing protein [Clostridium sp. D53t1_180928_C8]|uniref:AAA domain-containing protein n=1 Tax=Clostridium sp. D53t1_180928_C8 TaxID=2787101 RepID=UPI0018A95C50|nr:AAA domain-containing protein [Clostridium sp. D53t1_180928_C8]
MNIEKNLLLIKGEDKTEKVTYCKYNNVIRKYDVTFIGNKIYSYNYNNVIWISNSKEINIENKAIYENNKPLVTVKKAILFDDYIRVIHKNGYSKVYKRNEITIEESCLSNPKANGTFQYLKELSQSIGLMLDGSKTFLGKQYEKITYISPKSALAFYLNPNHIEKKKYYKNIIFPFGFNLSQKEATEKAFENKVSVIEGPPGTGKTQTILNIIANAIMNDKTVAVVSNNNAATENVYEKLSKYNLDFFAATLGRRENKEKFINSQSGLYVDMEEWKLEISEKQIILDKLNKSKEKISNMLKEKNILATIKNELSELLIEKKHFEKEYLSEDVAKLKYNTIKKLKADNIMKLLIDLELNGKGLDKVPFSIRIKNLFKYGIYNFKFYSNPIEEVLDYLYYLYYKNKENELNVESEKIQRELNIFNFDNELREYSNNALKIFKDKLNKRYYKNRSRQVFTEDDLWKKFDKVIGEYPVILSTTHSLRNCIPDNFLFDYLIIDESSQVDLLTGALALSCAKNVVVVGDLMQLTNVVSEEDKEISKKIFNTYNLNEAYDFSNNNLLSSITILNKDITKTLLKEHYRCHPKIINFCNKEFYNDELIILTDERDEDVPLVLYKTNEGNHARGTINVRQIDVIKEEVLPKLRSEKSIAVISPYRNQTNEISKLLGEMVEADTVHKFQGREKDVVILSTVANEVNEFIDNSNLINVAISRAVNKLIVVTSDFENEDSNIGDLIKYIQYNNFEVVESEISSIFDLLYKSYGKKLIETIKNSKRVSEFDSENLMNLLIEEVLSSSEFSNLGFAIHVPLKMIIRNTEKLTADERRFVLNPWTHTDFLIFNKLDKKPVLVVEVDGYKYHVQNEKQLERDKKKEGILEKYNVPIIRFRTDGSGERDRLEKGLRAVLK